MPKGQLILADGNWVDRWVLMFKWFLLGCTCLTTVGVSIAHADTSVLPSGGTFAAGSGSIHSDAASLTVKQNSINAVMTWNNFSIGSSGSVHFENGSGATLNRVTGNAISRIDGHLSATGSLYLMNSNGVVVGPQGSVKTGGSFVATTLEADEVGFMASGKLSLSGASDASVVNLGKVSSSGGNVVLAAHEVRNEGRVDAAGKVVFAASHEVMIADTSVSSDIMVRAGRSGDVTNRGLIETTVARLESAGGNVYALAGNTEGAIRATTATQEGGRILLRAAGRVEINSLVEAVGTTGDGGHIIAEGTHVALGTQARVDASGARNGGTVNVGGGWQGDDSAIRNAQTLSVAAGAEISVNGSDGDGGEAVLWADGHTDFAGHITARGSDTGQGGRVEVSGKEVLSFAGTVDTGGGTLLLDPTDISIVDTITGNATEGVLAGDYTYAEQEAVDASEIEAAVVATLLETNNVTITTENPLGNGSGNISVDAAITRSGGAGATTLTLAAENDIEVNAAIGTDDVSRPLNISLQAGNDVTISAAIETEGGTFNAVANNNIDVAATGSIDSAGGEIYVRTDDDDNAQGISNATGVFSVASGGLVTSAGGNIRIETQGLNIYGASLYATVLDAGAGDVYVDLANSGHVNLARRGTIGIWDGGLYLFSDDLSKISAANLHLNEQKNKGLYKYLQAYDSADQHNWGAGISDSIRIHANGGITIYGGFSNIETDLFIENSANGYNDLAISSPLTAKGNITLASPQIRLYTYGYYVQSAQGDLFIRTNALNYFVARSLRAPNGTVYLSGHAAGAYTVPNAVYVDAPRLVYGDAADTSTLSIGSMSHLHTANVTSEIVFQATDGLQFNGLFESHLAAVSLNPDSDGDLSGAVTFADNAGLVSGGDLVLNAAYFGPETAVFNGVTRFGATGDLTVDVDISSVGSLTLESDAEKDAFGMLSVLSGRTVSVSGSGERLSLLGSKVSLNGNLVVPNGIVSIRGPLEQPFDLGSVTDLADDTIELSASEISNIAAQELIIGNRGEAQEDIRVSEVVDTSSVGKVSLLTDNTFTIESGGGISADGELVVAAKTFVNQAGASAIDTRSGRYLIYSGSPLLDTTGGLVAPRRYGRSYVADPPLSISNPGDFFFYSYVPVLTISADDLSRTYGDGSPAFTYTVDTSGLLSGDSLADALSGTVKYTSAATAQSDVGEYDIDIDTSATASTLGYSIQASLVSGTLAIDPRALTVTTDDASKIYGNANPTFATSITGGSLAAHHASLGDVLSDLGFTTLADATSDVGDYAIEASSSGNANYDLTFVDGTLTIDPRALTVTTDDVSRIYGDPNPTFTASITGGALADHHASLGDGLSDLGFTTLADATSDVGDYAIEASGSNGNYDLTFVDGTLTIDPHVLTVTADDATRAEGAPDPIFTASFDGFQLGQDFSVLSGSLVFASVADSTSVPGDYTITPSGLSATNYAITYNVGTLVITERSVSPSTDAYVEIFDVLNRPAVVYGDGQNDSHFSGVFNYSPGQVQGGGPTRVFITLNGTVIGLRNGGAPFFSQAGRLGSGFFSGASGFYSQDGE